MKSSENITEIAKALLKSQSEMGNAVKGTSNPFFKSRFADLNAVREASLPVLNSNGITVLQPTIELNGEAYVETVLLHSSGQWLSSQTKVLYAKVGDAQGQGSGISYARRYGLQSFLNIGAEDDDGEGAMGRQNKPYTKATVPSTTEQLKSSTVLTSNPVAEMAADVNPAPSPLRKSNFRKAKPETNDNTPASSQGEGW